MIVADSVKNVMLLYLLDDPAYFRPSMLLGWYFRSVLGTEDSHPFGISGYLTRSPAGYLRNWAHSSFRPDVGSVVSYDKEQVPSQLECAAV